MHMCRLLLRDSSTPQWWWCLLFCLPPQSSSDDLNKGGVVADPLGEGHNVHLVKCPGVVAGGGEDDPQSSMLDVGLEERLLDYYVGDDEYMM